MNILISVEKIAKQIVAIWDQNLFADIGKYTANVYIPSALGWQVLKCVWFTRLNFLETCTRIKNISLYSKLKCAGIFLQKSTRCCWAWFDCIEERKASYQSNFLSNIFAFISSDELSVLIGFYKRCPFSAPIRNIGRVTMFLS